MLLFFLKSADVNEISVFQSFFTHCIEKKVFVPL